MDALLRKKDHLEQKLEKLRYREDERNNRRTSLVADIKTQKEILEVAKRNLETVKSVLLEKRQKFVLLKNEVRAYKKAKTSEIEVEFEETYRGIFEEASKIHPSTSSSTFFEFTKVRNLIQKNVFRDLGRRLNRFYTEEKEKLKSYILSQIGSKIKDKKKMHELIFYMKFLHKYEDYFEERVMIDFLYERLLKGFEYHFMSSRESNRLDKPEWFLDFILLKLGEDKEIFEIYSGLCHRRDAKGITDSEISREGTIVSGKDGHVVGVSVEREFRDLILRSCSLVEVKIVEVSESGSKQRRSLLLNFGSQIIRFQSEIFKSYGVVLNFPTLGDILCREQRVHVQSKLLEIHEMRYVNWFDGYRELSKECLFYIYRFKSMDSVFKMDDVVQAMIDYNTVFLESLRYINRQEIRVLCFLYSEFEEYKIFLLDQENEIVFDSGLTMESKPRVSKVKSVSGNNDDANYRETDVEHSQNLFCDAVLTSLERISRFNNENLKLIMSLAMNDTITGLRLMRNFLYNPGETSRNFVIDVGRFLEDYRGCSSYKAIKQMVKEKIDTFILEEVLLRYKLETEQYFELVGFLKSLKELFGDEDWKSDVASKCVGHVFEGRETNGSLFKIIKQLYEQ